MTKTALRQQTGISRTSLLEYERDITTPGTENLKLLLDALGITREQLYGDERLPAVADRRAGVRRGKPVGTPESKMGGVPPNTLARLGVRDVRFVVTWGEEGHMAVLVANESSSPHISRRHPRPAGQASDTDTLRALGELFTHLISVPLDGGGT